MFTKLSIIIPALNEEKHIANCISAISSLDRCGLEIEIIVVDNGSTDGTFNLAQEHGAMVYVLKGVKIAGLRNFGARQSTGNLLAFVDADCVVASDWLRNALETIEREKADAVGSFHSIPSDAGWIGRIAGLIQHKKVGAVTNYIPSGNFIVNRSVFKSLNGFNEQLETSEDVDICHRLKKNGFKIFLDPAIRSIHYGTPNTISEMFFRELWHGKSVYSEFFNELLAIKNFRLVLYSTINLFLIFSVFLSIYLLFFKKYIFFLVSSMLYIILNIIPTYLDWKKIKKYFIQLYIYTAIYGLARSFSLLKWLMGK